MPVALHAKQLNSAVQSVLKQLPQYSPHPYYPLFTMYIGKRKQAETSFHKNSKGFDYCPGTNNKMKQSVKDFAVRYCLQVDSSNCHIQ